MAPDLLCAHEEGLCQHFLPIKLSEERQHNLLNSLSVPKNLVLVIVESKYSKNLPAVLTFFPDFCFFIFKREQLGRHCPNYHSIVMSW